MKKLIILPFIATIILFTCMTSSCKKSTEAVKSTADTDSTVYVGFHFHTFIGTNLVDPVMFPSQWFTDSLNRLLNLEVAQFYITNIAIHLYGTSTWIPISGDVVLKRINNEVYPLATIKSAEMDSVRFTVGLGNGLNSAAPSAYSTSSPLDSVLSTNEQTAMWGSGAVGSSPTTGYTFMNIQGYDSTDHLPLSYQIGGFGDTVNIQLGYPSGFNFVPVLTGGQLNLIHIIADYGKLMQVLYPFTNSNTNSTFYGPSPNNPVPAKTLWQNIQNMFRWECTPPINC